MRSTSPPAAPCSTVTAAPSSTPDRSRRSSCTKKAMLRAPALTCRTMAARTGAAARSIRRRAMSIVNTTESGSIGWIEARDPDGNYGRGAEGSTQPYDRGIAERTGGLLLLLRQLYRRGWHPRHPAMHPPAVGAVAGRGREQRRNRLGEQSWHYSATGAGAGGYRLEQHLRRADGDGGRAGVHRRDRRPHCSAPSIPPLARSCGRRSWNMPPTPFR